MAPGDSLPGHSHPPTCLSLGPCCPRVPWNSQLQLRAWDAHRLSSWTLWDLPAGATAPSTGQHWLSCWGLGPYEAMLPTTSGWIALPYGTRPTICVALGLGTWVPGLALPFLTRLASQRVRPKECLRKPEIIDCPIPHRGCSGHLEIPMESGIRAVVGGRKPASCPISFTSDFGMNGSPLVYLGTGVAK